MNPQPSLSEPPGETDLLSGYPAPADGYDELIAESGRPRPHCRRFVEALHTLGPAELQRRREQARRLIQENGATYAAFGDPQEPRRAWEFDPLPLVISANEWRALSAGLKQRARLLNLVLADLYGPQKLLTRGLLPPALLFAQPGFLRPCHGLKVPDDTYLHLCAADLARGPDGRWRVVGDRTEIPAGAGYALETRIVTSRILPGVMRDCRVERLASAFIALRETLQELAPRSRENPRIVLLSQGPHSPQYFEDAYLARYLGYTLVEGDDLAVRNDRVQLKTLGGLLPVEVILRRVHSPDCDPLELRGDSARGIAGLVQAARSGNVVLANALGSGLVESPAFLPYLPRLCRELLGEDLLLPVAETWWCGDPESRRHVLEHLDRLVIRPAFRAPWQGGPPADELTRQGRAALADAVRARPQDFVAQDPVTRSSAPVLAAVGLQPRFVALRTYAVASRGDYDVMPGGLARVSSSPRPLDASAMAGEVSKDAWVLSRGPVREVTLLQPPGAPIELRRSGSELPSRVADNLFWLGRQAERVEGKARLLRTALVRLTGEGEARSLPDLNFLLRGLAEQGQIEPGYAVEEIRGQLPLIETALPAAVFDPREPMGLRRTLSAMHHVASTVRDRISIDSWRLVNRIDQEFVPRPGGATDLNDLLAMLNRLILDLSAYSGLVSESMTRTLGWRFLDLGRRLERALQTIFLTQNLLNSGNPPEPAVLDAALEVADSQMTYRNRYLANLRLTPVLDLLLTDETNPRGLAFQLTTIVDHVENLPRDQNEPLRSLHRRMTLSALNNLRMVDAPLLTENRTPGLRSPLERLLARLAEQLPRIADAVSHRYLIHAGHARQLTDIPPDPASGR